MTDHGPTPRATILIVEDDEQVAQIETEILESSGYRVCHAGTGAEAKMLLETARPDLIILDLMLPDADGLLLSGKLRAAREIPIIICSGLDSKRERVLGLKLGADDFIAKPFDPDEFEARVEAVLRRSKYASGSEADDSQQAEQQIRLGNLVVDRSRRRAQLGDYSLDLTPTEYRLLVALANQPGEVLSRDDLAKQVWGYQDASSGRTIDVHIRRLRMKLSGTPVEAPPIVAVRGFGYRIDENLPERATA